MGAPGVRQDASARTEEATERALHASLTETYLSRRENLIRFLAARCGSLGQAEDLAQDLFLKIAAVDPAMAVENPTALVYRMAANLATDHLRQTRRGVVRDQAWRVLQGTPAEDVRADAPPADEIVAARQRLAALLQAAERLPARRRLAFRLHKIEGRTRAETARLLGVSIKAVEKQITAALKALAWPDEP